MEITYHKANSTHIPLLIDYRIEFLVDFWGEQQVESVGEVKKELSQYFQKAIDDSTYISYIAKEGERVAGVGGIVIRQQPGNFKNPTGRVGYLVSMYTVPFFRKRGICTTILNLLLRDANEMGITAFELHATKEGESVYKKNGFNLHPEPTLRKYSGITEGRKHSLSAR